MSGYGLTNGVTGIVAGLVPVKINGKTTTLDMPSLGTTVYFAPPILLFRPDAVHPALTDVQYPGCPPGVFPIFPIEETLSVDVPMPDRTVQKMRVKRKQLPVTGADCRTDYKAQGNTFTHAIVDLAEITASAGPYVMLSRLTTHAGLLILRDFPSQNLKKPFDKKLKAAEERLR